MQDPVRVVIPILACRTRTTHRRRCVHQWSASPQDYQRILARIARPRQLSTLHTGSCFLTTPKLTSPTPADPQRAARRRVSGDADANHTLPPLHT